jgi:hypothetical protein
MQVEPEIKKLNPAGQRSPNEFPFDCCTAARQTGLQAQLGFTTPIGSQSRFSAISSTVYQNQIKGFQNTQSMYTMYNGATGSEGLASAVISDWDIGSVSGMGDDLGDD